MTVTVAAVTGIVRPAALPVPSFAPTEAPPPRPLLQAALAALPAARGWAALLLPAAPRLAAHPARWRMADAILRDAAAAGGGMLLRSAAGGTLLLGTSPATARRAAAALGSLVGEARPLPVWPLPEEAGAVLAWAAAQAPAPAPAPPAPALVVAGLHRVLDGLAAEAVLRAETLVGPAGEARGRRIRLARPAIAAALGPLAEDPDLLAHAEDRLAARLLPGLAAWAADHPGLRLVPLPRDRLPVPALRPGAVGVLPLAAAAAPGFADRRRLLAERGWGVALAGLGAATLGLLDLRHLPADLLLVRWSPDLTAPGLTAALRTIDSARLVLAAAPDAAARDFARAAGLLLARSA